MRKGLQRRYDLETILQLHGGDKKITGLPYNATAMLRNPLYVKMAEQLSDDSRELNNKIINNVTNIHQTRQFTSTNDLPHDMMSDLTSQSPPPPSPPPPPGPSFPPFFPPSDAPPPAASIISQARPVKSGSL